MNKLITFLQLIEAAFCGILILTVVVRMWLGTLWRCVAYCGKAGHGAARSGMTDFGKAWKPR